MQYETERLIIRPTDISDASFVLKLMNTPKWIANIGDRNVKSIVQAEKYIETKMLPQLKRLGYSNNTIILKSNQTKIGSCGLYDREGLDGVDIGFALLEEYEGQGYAFESATKIMELAKNEFNISLVSAITTKNNIPSQKLIERLGLKFIEFVNLPNDPEELMLYRIEF